MRSFAVTFCFGVALGACTPESHLPLLDRSQLPPPSMSPHLLAVGRGAFPVKAARGHEDDVGVVRAELVGC